MIKSLLYDVGLKPNSSVKRLVLLGVAVFWFSSLVNAQSRPKSSNGLGSSQKVAAGVPVQKEDHDDLHPLEKKEATPVSSVSSDRFVVFTPKNAEQSAGGEYSAKYLADKKEKYENNLLKRFPGSSLVKNSGTSVYILRVTSKPAALKVLTGLGINLDSYIETGSSLQARLKKLNVSLIEE